MLLDLEILSFSSKTSKQKCPRTTIVGMDQVIMSQTNANMNGVWGQNFSALGSSGSVQRQGSSVIHLLKEPKNKMVNYASLVRF